MRVMGIDPGLRNMGWGIIDVAGSKLRHVGNGVCRSDATADLSTRLLELYTQLTDVLARFSPDCAAVEQTFVNKDGQRRGRDAQARPSPRHRTFGACASGPHGR